MADGFGSASAAFNCPVDSKVYPIGRSGVAVCDKYAVPDLDPVVDGKFSVFEPGQTGGGLWRNGRGGICGHADSAGGLDGFEKSLGVCAGG